MADPASPLDGRCPRCGEEPTEAHVRGPAVVLVPCGHTIDALSSLEIPPGEPDADGSAPPDGR